jgi:leucyl/phenylalanyl-tRNA--protein transferase
MPWWSPDPRAVLPVDGVHRARSLRRRLRNCGWSTTLNAAFAEVVRHCARTGEAGEAHGDGPGGGHGDEDAWITPELAAAYQELHELGWAHSIEVWDGDELVGGMYGVLVGAAGMLESMFHVRTDASKVALVDFVDRFAAAGGTLLDVQFVTPHLESLGALEVPRADYLARLREARDADVRLETERLPVARLAPFGGR